ncbi:MAG TPA: DNA polymerase III subunit gamma/tau [Candidatus Dormibacteraeota bacterium]|nr:DNA polymerase III subunit gamma/tau [Candidatus Dormibacteraeota bacterium]
MTHQSLYRKYRSQSFADMVGQEAMARALRGAIASDRVAHAYLFSGSRGTGKTTTARLLAKAVNCLRRAPGQSEPCNECESCVQVQNGSALDMIEIDAASNRGIDEIRELRERVNLAPALGRRKVYIVDEAHMLTPEAFNALLKTLEEPPPHVVFVLCTTEANKVPLTVLGRCQQFVFRRFSDEQVVGHLERVAAAEGIVVQRDALALLAHVAQGSMRDALGLLDQLVPLSDGPITLAAARDLLGVADPAQVDALLDLVLGGRASEALGALGGLYEGGAELRQVVRGLMERCRDRLVEAIEARDGAGRDRLSTVLDSLLHLDGEMRRHAEPRFLVEATLVRLAVATGPTAADRNRDAAGAGSLRQPARPGPASPPSPASPPVAPVRPDVVPDAVPVAAVAPGPGTTAPSPEPVVADAEVGEGWRRVLEALQPKPRAYFREARPALEGGRLVLRFPYSFHYKQALENAGEVERLVRSWLGEDAGVDLRPPDPAPAAAAPAATPPAAPEEDPVIKAAERKLEAKVVRVRPLKEAR